jgi:NitT/TauT family transport system substrate-binding protein
MFRFVAATFFVLAGAGTAVAQQTTITFAHLANPSHNAALYAIEQGIVTSDKINVEVRAMDIAALQQAIAARSFDVVEAAAMAIPRAQARGLDLQIIGVVQRALEENLSYNIWVRPDSPIQTADDLKGKRMGAYTLSSAGMTLTRIALNQVHGLNVDRQGGDLQWVELPESALAAALAAGNVDATVLIHGQAYEALTTGEFRHVLELGRDLNEKFGLLTISSVLVAYGDRLAEDPESFREFLRMFRESVEYTLVFAT